MFVYNGHAFERVFLMEIGIVDSSLVISETGLLLRITSCLYLVVGSFCENVLLGNMSILVLFNLIDWSWSKESFLILGVFVGVLVSNSAEKLNIFIYDDIFFYIRRIKLTRTWIFCPRCRRLLRNTKCRFTVAQITNYTLQRQDTNRLFIKVTKNTIYDLLT